MTLAQLPPRPPSLVFNCLLSICGLLIVAVSSSAQEATIGTAPASRPNIILIMVDDMGFSDIGCYGGEIETPNLDALAQGGLRFSQFYNSGRCCPTRASLLTGLHPHQVGIGHMTEPPEEPLGVQGAYQGFLNQDCVTLAEVLRASGYRTLMTGKWHLGLHRRDTWPRQRGFDRFYGCLSGAINYFKPGGKRGMMLDNEPVETDEEFYATDTLTNYACEFIEESLQQDRQRPFFLYLAYNAPHWPLNAKVSDFEKYRGKYRDGWQPLMRRRLAKQVELGLFPANLKPAPHVGPEWNSLTEKQRDNLDAIMAAYAACIDSIDQNIGRLSAYLAKTGQLDNTLILFLSDNGACQEGGRLGKGSEKMVRQPPLETTDGVRLGLAWANACNTPFRLYKHFLHEGGACTPLIVSWPAGIPEAARGHWVREFGYLPDIMATFVDLANGTYPSHVPTCQGKSLMPLIRGQRQPVHTEPVFWEHEGNASVRHGNWKLVREYQKPWELYDLSADRTELQDLSQAHPERKREMIALWENWGEATGVAFPERFNMYEFLRKKRAEQKE